MESAPLLILIDLPTKRRWVLQKQCLYTGYVANTSYATSQYSKQCLCS